MIDFSQIIHRTADDSYVITKNGMPYHVYPYAAEFAEEWDAAFAYAEVHPECVTEEQPYVPPVPILILLRGISDCSGSAWRPTLSSHAFPRYAALSETARPTLPKPRYSGLVGFHHIVQGFHGFFDGCARVPSVDDVEINVVHAQSLQAVVDLA